PAYNAARWIRETIQSVVKQGLTSIELIVVDDGSVDATASIVESEFPSARLVRAPNEGASRARNRGTAEAAGQFVQYLDADDVLASGKIQTQINTLLASSADVAYGDWQRLVANEGGEFKYGEIVARQMFREPELELIGDFWCPPAAYLF